MTPIQIYIDPKLKRLIKQDALDADSTLSEIIRQLLRQHYGLEKK